MSFNPLGDFLLFSPCFIIGPELRSASFRLLTSGSHHIHFQDTTFRFGSKHPSPFNSVVFCFSCFRLPPNSDSHLQSSATSSAGAGDICLSQTCAFPRGKARQVYLTILRSNLRFLSQRFVASPLFYQRTDHNPTRAESSVNKKLT